MKKEINNNPKINWDIEYKNTNINYYQFDNMILNKIIKKSKIKKDSNILDYGFGRGELLIDLYKLGYRQLFGNEISKEAIKIFKENIKKKI